MLHSPPPLFKQGASARARVLFFSMLSLCLLVVDARLHSLALVRQTLGTVLYPLQQLAVLPRDAVRNLAHHFADKTELEQENSALKRTQVEHAQHLQEGEQLRAENAHLRRLLDARARAPVAAQLAEILYDARDPTSHRVIIDRGLKDGLTLAQPVIDAEGVVGQITRIFPLSAEVTLLTDRNQAIPVQVLRSGLRSVAYGRGQAGLLDMRLTSNADVQVGDVLVTSGIDGVYPPGLKVARVTRMDNRGTTPFETVLCTPLAGIDRHRQLLVLKTDVSHLTPPDNEEVRVRKEKINRRLTRDAAPPETTPHPAPTPAPASHAGATPVTPAAPLRPEEKR